MEKTKEQKFIEEKVDSINTIGITDPIDEEYLREICVEYVKLFGTKKPTKKVIEVDIEKAKEFNDLYPKAKLPSGKYGHCNIKEVLAAFTWFFKNYPQYTWDTILNATQIYLTEREHDNWQWTRRSKYFIRKQMQDKTYESDLAEYCERLSSGVQDDGDLFIFSEKIV